MSRILLTFVLLASALLALFVSVMNSTRVDIELAFAKVASPLGLALVIAFTVGLLAGLAWQVKWVAQLLAERGRLRRALRIAEAKARKDIEASK